MRVWRSLARWSMPTWTEKSPGLVSGDEGVRPSRTGGGLQNRRPWVRVPPPLQCLGGSVEEHPLGKGEALGSIHSRGSMPV